jgi:uncharacterized protein
MITRSCSRAALALALLALPSATGCAASPSPPPTAPPAGAAPASEASPWPQELDHPSTPETHRRAVYGLFDVMRLKTALESALDTSLRTQIEANPKLRPLEPVMRRFMQKYLSIEGIRDPLARLYMDRFSELEIVQLTAFYRTPLGQRTTTELPKLLEEGGKIGMRLVQDHMDELKDMIRQHIQAP